jgi:hypothetical protein
MKHQKIARTTLLVGTVLLLMLNSAWASAQQDAIETAATEQVESTVDAVTGSNDEEASTAGEEAGPAAEPGMDIPMDGTSLETWNASLEEVKEVGGIKAYNRIQDAFDYLLMFDVGAKNNPEILASRLNGLTGAEILKRVAYRRGR